MVGWHHQASGHEFEQTLGDGEGHGRPGVPQSSPWSAMVRGVAKSQARLSDSTTRAGWKNYFLSQQPHL